MTNVVTTKRVEALDLDEIGKIAGGMRLDRYDDDIDVGIAWPTYLYDYSHGPWR